MNDFWALTTYYNPTCSRRRRSNYCTFRRFLDLPLLTVELAYGDSFELSSLDADILVQIPGTSVLWQKERLLNVALEKLPEAARAVAWLDCDIILKHQAWPRVALDLLDRFPLIQLFDSVSDLGIDDLDGIQQVEMSAATGLSISSLVSEGVWNVDDLPTSPVGGMRRTAFGLAWAAKLTLIGERRFYDAMILGGGDRALACAAYGRFHDFICSAHLDAQRASHYLDWARPFFDSVRGNVGCLPGRLVHCWHGDLANRGYTGRHQDLARVAFDPRSDIAIGESGCWVWSSDRPHLHELVQKYFKERNEDGDNANASRGL